MLRHQKLISQILYLFILLPAISTTALAQTNLDFEQGIKGWEITGNVSSQKLDAQHGTCYVQIGKGYGKLQMRVAALPLSIVQYQAYIKSDHKGVNGYSFISFYDAQKKLLLTYKSKALDSTGWQQTGNYTETPAGTKYIEIGIENDPSGKGYVYADNFSIQMDTDMMKTKPAPTCNLDQYMKPFWKGDTVYNETVLLLSEKGKPASGRLLYTPTKILSVKSFDLGTTYNTGKDYTISGNTMTKTANSAMPYQSDTFFDTKDVAWYNLQSQWVVITYTHHDKWNGPLPQYKAVSLPHTLAKLKNHAPLKIVALGMSITRGMDVSSYDWAAPYMPTYVDLFARQLKKQYHYGNITLYNAGLPGAQADWGAAYADKYVNPLKPDLVILDFGMNDFWSFKPDQLKAEMLTIITKIKAGNPNVEFILLTNMKFDPDYITDANKFKSFYLSNMAGYVPMLKQLEAAGVVNLDMYSISSAIYTKKKAKDCLVNPLHPNDYMARWHAQGLAALFAEK
jgi:lysophospholipase L1-like esterase